MTSRESQLAAAPHMCNAETQNDRGGCLLTGLYDDWPPPAAYERQHCTAADCPTERRPTCASVRAGAKTDGRIGYWAGANEPTRRNMRGGRRGSGARDGSPDRRLSEPGDGARDLHKERLTPADREQWRGSSKGARRPNAARVVCALLGDLAGSARPRGSRATDSELGAG